MQAVEGWWASSNVGLTFDCRLKERFWQLTVECRWRQQFYTKQLNMPTPLHSWVFLVHVVSTSLRPGGRFLPIIKSPAWDLCLHIFSSPFYFNSNMHLIKYNTRPIFPKYSISRSSNLCLETICRTNIICKLIAKSFQELSIQSWSLLEFQSMEVELLKGALYDFWQADAWWLILTVLDIG